MYHTNSFCMWHGSEALMQADDSLRNITCHKDNCLLRRYMPFGKHALHSLNKQCNRYKIYSRHFIAVIIPSKM